MQGFVRQSAGEMLVEKVEGAYLADLAGFDYRPIVLVLYFVLSISR